MLLVLLTQVATMHGFEGVGQSNGPMQKSSVPLPSRLPPPTPEPSDVLESLCAPLSTGELASFDCAASCWEPLSCVLPASWVTVVSASSWEPASVCELASSLAPASFVAVPVSREALPSRCAPVAASERELASFTGPLPLSWVAIQHGH